MEHIKTVGIRELKNNLSAYIRELKGGWRILVSDRNQVVAELCKPFLRARDQTENALVIGWAQEGKITLPTAPSGSYPSSPIRLRAGVSLKCLDEERGE